MTETTTTTTTARPTIDFGTDIRATARTYAADADSRILPDRARTVLQAAAAGEEVDAYDLNAALTQAMSAAATRHGQSMGRRDLTRKIRHLTYIVQGVLEAHADGLPVFEKGERSRLNAEIKEALRNARLEVEALKVEVSEARDEVETLTASRDEVADVLAYALDQVCAAKRERVFGYRDGIRA